MWTNSNARKGHVAAQQTSLHGLCVVLPGLRLWGPPECDTCPEASPHQSISNLFGRVADRKKLAVSSFNG